MFTAEAPSLHTASIQPRMRVQSRPDSCAVTLVAHNGSALRYQRSSTLSTWCTSTLPLLPTATGVESSFIQVFEAECGIERSQLAIDGRGLLFQRLVQHKPSLVTQILSTSGVSAPDHGEVDGLLRSAHWQQIDVGGTPLDGLHPLLQLSNATVMFMDVRGRVGTIECAGSSHDNSPIAWRTPLPHSKSLSQYPRFDYGSAFSVVTVLDYGSLQHGSLFGVSGSGQLVERTFEGHVIHHGSPQNGTLRLFDALGCTPSHAIAAGSEGIHSLMRPLLRGFNVTVNDVRARGAQQSTLQSLFVLTATGLLAEFAWSDYLWSWSWHVHPAVGVSAYCGGPVSMHAHSPLQQTLYLLSCDGQLVRMSPQQPEFVWSLASKLYARPADDYVDVGSVVHVYWQYTSFPVADSINRDVCMFVTSHKTIAVAFTEQHIMECDDSGQCLWLALSPGCHRDGQWAIVQMGCLRMHAIGVGVMLQIVPCVAAAKP